LLVLLSFGLVLVATVLLVLGLLVGDGLTLIYISIGLSALAAVILFVAVRISKPKTADVGAAAAAPTPTGAPVEVQPEPQYAAVAPTADPTTTMPTTPPVAPEPPAPAAPVVAAATAAAAAGAESSGDEWLAADQEWEEPAAEWLMETTSPGNLVRVGGWRRDIVKPGDQVEIVFHPLREPDKKSGLMRQLKLLATGEVFAANIRDQERPGLE